MTDIKLLNEKIQHESAFVDILQMEVGKVIIGQKYMVERLLIGLLSNGHVLLEGVPGLAKTLSIKTLASAIQAKFQRIQFTPDLLPADVIGTMIFNQKNAEFTVRKGPIFANFILADEINRAPAKVQSALLEAMQERQITIGENTFKLDEPFLVLATQNPIEQEGTYPLPEAQVDRFMLKIKIDYPNRDEERLIMRQNIADTQPQVKSVVNPADILKARAVVQQVYMDEKIERYILDIVFATRKPKDFKLDKLTNLISYGASPRASINLALGGKVIRFHKTTWICDTRRYSCGLPRCSPPSNCGYIRSRSRKSDVGKYYRRYTEHYRSSLVFMETSELIKKVRKIEIRTKGLVNQIFSGEYHSVFKGRGMSFSEVREYQFGDDIRTIDWNVSARFNHPYVKIYEEERELTVMLVVDVSGSGEFGTVQQMKKDIAAELCAVFGVFRASKQR